MLQINDQLLQTHEKLRTDLKYFSEKCLKIKTKAGDLVPLVFNQAQLYIDALIQEQIKVLGRVRVILSKGRQQGCSTYVSARFFRRSTTSTNKSTFILSHDSSTTDTLFDVVDLFYQNLPEPMRPGCSTKNRRKLVFEGLNSVYTVGTAGNADIGRGGTLQMFHGSEVAFWENTDNIDTGILQSVSDLPGTEVVLESTANGASGYYYEKCMFALEGKGDYKVIFVPWFWQSEYQRIPEKNFVLTEEEAEMKRVFGLSDSQVCWYRMKLEDFRGRAWKMKQEYPCTIMEAFQSSGENFFPAVLIVTAMKNHDPVEHGAPLIVGVDPAGGGKDSVTFAWRRGRSFQKYEEILAPEKDIRTPMTVVGRIIQILEQDEADMVFIDKGYGDAIIARLHEMGYGNRVIGVDFGGGALDKTKYANMRTEIHDKAREWLCQTGASIPDDFKVQKQFFSIPQEKPRSDGRMLLASKEEAKKRNNGESPGITDSLCLTFAYPVRSRGQAAKFIRTPDSPADRLQQQYNSPLLTMRPQTSQNGNSGFPLLSQMMGR